MFVHRLHTVGWRIAAAVLSGALLVAAGISAYSVVGVPAWRLYANTSGCAPATEFTVITTPAVRATADELVGEFEASTAGFGCATAHGYVYDAPENVIVANVAKQWKADDNGVPQRDVGPRPDVWLTESTLPLNRLADEKLAPDPVAVDRSFGVSPLVLTSSTDSHPPPLTLPEAFKVAKSEPGVVRPDPLQSTTGLLAAAALYGAQTDTWDPAPKALSDHDVETALGAAQSRGAFADGDESAVLCRYQTLGDHLPDLLLSEQAVRRFNTAPDRTGPCSPSADSIRVRQLFVVPTSGRTPTLDHRFVRFSWSTGAEAPTAVGAFDTWLSSAAGRRAIQDTELHPTVPGDPASDDLVARGDVLTQAIGAPQKVGTVLGRYTLAHTTRHELLAVDVSGSMNTKRGAVSRYDTVVQAVTGAVTKLRTTDEIGLSVFPDASDRHARPVVAIAAQAGDAVVGALRSQVPRGDTPLFQTIFEAVRSLNQPDGGEPEERRLVVVTDGEDTSSQVDQRTLLDAVRVAEVKIYLITLGDVNCAAVPLSELADASGGRCFDPGPTGDDLTTAMSG